MLIKFFNSIFAVVAALLRPRSLLRRIFCRYDSRASRYDICLRNSSACARVMGEVVGKRLLSACSM